MIGFINKHLILLETRVLLYDPDTLACCAYVGMYFSCAICSYFYFLPRHHQAARHHGRGHLTLEQIPILQLGHFLLVTIQVELHDELAMTLQDDLTTKIITTNVKGDLIDISSLEMIDSFIGRMISNISAMARVLDAETVVVGMQPAVAITLVELGLTLKGVRTALSVDRGMDLLNDSRPLTFSDPYLEEFINDHPHGCPA